MNTSNKKLDAELKLHNLKIDVWDEYNLNKTVPWVNDILAELIKTQKDNVDTTYQQGEEENISLSLNFLRKNTPSFKDHLMTDGRIVATYNAACIKCLAPTPIQIDMEFKSLHLNSSLRDLPEYAEIDEIFTENAQRELYFYSKGTLPLREMLQEYLFMGIVPFPIHDENCLGLCAVCGINLNHETCKH